MTDPLSLPGFTKAHQRPTVTLSPNVLRRNASNTKVEDVFVRFASVARSSNPASASPGLVFPLMSALVHGFPPSPDGGLDHDHEQVLAVLRQGVNELYAEFGMRSTVRQGRRIPEWEMHHLQLQTLRDDIYPGLMRLLKEEQNPFALEGLRLADTAREKLQESFMTLMQNPSIFPYQNLLKLVQAIKPEVPSDIRNPNRKAARDLSMLLTQKLYEAKYNTYTENPFDNSEQVSMPAPMRLAMEIRLVSALMQHHLPTLAGKGNPYAADAIAPCREVRQELVRQLVDTLESSKTFPFPRVSSLVRTWQDKTPPKLVNSDDHEAVLDILMDEGIVRLSRMAARSFGEEWRRDDLDPDRTPLGLETTCLYHHLLPAVTRMSSKENYVAMALMPQFQAQADDAITAFKARYPHYRLM